MIRYWEEGRPRWAVCQRGEVEIAKAVVLNAADAANNVGGCFDSELWKYGRLCLQFRPLQTAHRLLTGLQESVLSSQHHGAFLQALN